MPSLGTHLQQLRRSRGVSLEEIARLTRVSPQYLEALEADTPGVLPAPVFARGFIRAYCQALGAEADEALALYGAATDQTATAERRVRLSAATAGERRAPGTVLVSFVLLVVLGIALFTVTLVLQPGREPRAERRPVTGVPVAQAPEPPAPGAAAPVVAVGPGTPVDGPVVAPTPPTPAAPAAPEPPVPAAAPVPAPLAPALASAIDAAVGTVSGPYRLVARTSEPTWLRVRTADGRQIEETIPTGQVREWVSDRPFTVTVGNAGGVALELNGRSLPPLGASGTVISHLVLPPGPR